MSSDPIAHFPSEWGDPPETLALSRDRVHVWMVRLNPTPPRLQVFWQTLAPDERARAERFHFERDRRRFIAARGQLRMILGRYALVDPTALAFSYGPRGKPFLSHPQRTPAISFNLSHSGELALAAVTHDRSVGVDIEEMRALNDAEGIAERFFSPREYSVFRAIPEQERLEGFYRCWTCKEAYVKATGDGLARPTESFDVAFSRGAAARLLSVEGEADEAARWSMAALEPARGYIGAIAVEGHNWSLACWRL